LKIGYKSPEALLAELTKSVGRGGVRIESKRSLPRGTIFIFELKAPGVARSVEVTGKVETVSESAPGTYVLHIRYEPPSDHAGLDAVIAQINLNSKHEKKRSHPRIPMHVRAVENRPNSPTYRLRDLSQGGVGIDVEGGELPDHVKVGDRFLLRMKLTTGQLAVTGSVVWAGPVPPTADGTAQSPRIGVAFDMLPAHMLGLLKDLLALRALPAPPWIARLAFGADAVASAAR